MHLAVIVLNRNLPSVTDLLCEKLMDSGVEKDRVFVLEAGSDDDKLSKYCNWHVKDDETRRLGLRYNRGMNQALINLYQSKNWKKFDGFLLLANDTEFTTASPVERLEKVLQRHERVGILSPCSKHWGESMFIPENSEKYLWSISSSAIVVMRSFIEKVCNTSGLSNRNFLFDGSNFRGYLTDMELVAKAYINDWAFAITKTVYAEENTSYLLTIPDIIKTESYEENLRLYVNEGLKWALNKYSFQSKWDFLEYTKFYYDKFFDINPNLNKYRV